jgi:hypothetical protein
MFEDCGVVYRDNIKMERNESYSRDMNWFVEGKSRVCNDGNRPPGSVAPRHFMKTRVIHPLLKEKPTHLSSGSKIRIRWP